MATNWEDVQDNYMVNENAINWSGALVYALALFLPEGEWPPLPPDPVPEIDAGTDAGAGDADASVVRAGRPAIGGGGCGCGVASTGRWQWGSLPGALLGLCVARRRRRGQGNSTVVS